MKLTPYVKQLQNFICKIKGSRKMEERFMIFEEMLKEEREEGREEGRSVLKETLLLCLQSFGKTFQMRSWSRFRPSRIWKC